MGPTSSGAQSIWNSTQIKREVYFAGHPLQEQQSPLEVYHPPLPAKIFSPNYSVSEQRHKVIIYVLFDEISLKSA
jgi:hypothetical protein